MNKRKIYFRADASANIGYGHFIRSLALADMLKDDFDCTFFTQNPSVYQIKEMAKVCHSVSLPADNSRFNLFLNNLEGDEIVVLDNYFFTTDYQKQIKKKGCKLVCIDDMHDKHYVADVVVNQSPVVEEDFDKEPYTKLYLGKNYELLRKPFLQPLRNLKRNNNVIISFGGADPMHLTDKVVSLLVEIDLPYHIITILGDKAIISDENKVHVDIKSKLSAQQMADLFETSAFGILSASTVSLEAMSRRLPIMIGYYVDNQKEGYEKFKERGNFIPLGYIPDLKKKRLEEALWQLGSFKATKRDYSLIPERYKQIFHML